MGSDPISKLDIPLFSIQQLPGKGKGLVASVNIGKGKRIISETPLFTTQNLTSKSMMEPGIAAKIKALSKPDQRRICSLHNNFPGKFPFTGIVRTNALPCGLDSLIGGIYPTICLINHSCLPNAHNSWNSETERENIHAIRPIEAGEEITIFAEREYEARVMYEGEDNPETQRIKGLKNKPARHRSFKAASNSWTTTKGSVPKGLDTLEFEKWLWREGK